MIQDLETLQVPADQLVEIMVRAHKMGWFAHSIDGPNSANLPHVKEEGEALEAALAGVTPHMRTIMTAFGTRMQSENLRPR